jgi:hypothetical protein
VTLTALVVVAALVGGLGGIAQLIFNWMVK